MGAYNLYHNQHNCHNEILLNKILKHDWKFDGVVVSDWGGTHDTDEAVMNGLDMEFGTGTDGLRAGTKNAYENYYMAYPYLMGIREGKYSEKELNDKVRRVLRLYYRTTMNRNRPNGFLCSEAHYAAARKIGDEGVVLLKNDKNVLPVDTLSAHNILVVGENAIKMMTVGGGSSSLKAQKEISPLQGLREALSCHNIKVDYERGYVGDVTGSYNGVTTGQDLNDKRSAAKLIEDAVVKARKADYVILFGGLNKSDYQDCEGHDRKEYGLPYGQDKLVEALAKANKKLVFVNISGNAVAMPWKNKVNAILQGWFVGSESGEVLADIITGKANPSGKLPFTWVASLNDVPAHRLNAYPGKWRADHKIIDEEYKEGLYVGYRGVDKFMIKPMFAFGHGLSYTSFKITNICADKQEMTRDGKITFTVNVKNTGKREGSEVVQLYINDVKSSLPRPYKELKGFAKVSLNPGESKDVSITIDNNSLSYYDNNKSEWVSESGAFKALIGNSSDHIIGEIGFVLR